MKHEPRKPLLEEGEVIEIEAQNLNSVCEGVGRHEGLTVFIPGILPGETAQAVVEKNAKSFSRARARILKNTSGNREKPLCPHHLQHIPADNQFTAPPNCGGCQMQMLSRPEQLKFKQSMVQEALIRIAGIEQEVLPTQGGCPWRYRNKMSFSLTESAGHLRWGLRSHESNDIAVPLESCSIAREPLWEWAEKIIELLDAEFGPSIIWDGERGCVRSATIRYHTGRPNLPVTMADRASASPTVIALFAVATRDMEIPRRIRECLKAFPIVNAHFTYSDPRANAVYYDRAHYLIFAEDRGGASAALPFARWGEANFREENCCWHTTGDWATLVGPTSFLQVNDEMAERLYQRALSLPFEGKGYAIDAYCGVGVLTRALAEQFEEVMGIELDTQSIKLARTTSRRLNRCSVEWVAEASEAVFARLGKQSPREIRRLPDLVVLDPPRKGCQNEVLRALIKLKPADVVYISCHPAALARDLKILCKDVFRIDRVEPFDLFPQTHHVETLVHLKRK